MPSSGRGKFSRILSPLPTTALEIPPTRLLAEAEGISLEAHSNYYFL